MAINIKIFSDYMWPFCYIGKGIVDKLKEEYDIVDDWIGFELHPETSLEGMSLIERFGKDNLEMNKSKLNNMGQDFGIKFGKLEHMPNSHKALLSAEYARSQNKFHQYHDALLKGYFTDDMDIGNLDVLLRLGESIGLNPSQMRASIESGEFEDSLKSGRETAERFNVRSTPTFIINDEHVINGIQSLDNFKDLLNSL